MQCISEVQQYAKQFEETHIIPALDGGILKSDDLMTLTQKKNILQAVSHLREDSPGPGSFFAKPHRFLKPVDPYLFPFSFQRSRCLKDGTVGRYACIDQCGKGQIAGLPEGAKGEYNGSLRGRGCYANDKAWSLQYQWLPFDVRFDKNRSSTRYFCSTACVIQVIPINWSIFSIVSYINNVHPVLHEKVYTAIEEIINEAIPLFNRTLTSIETPSRFVSPRIPVEGEGEVPNREPGVYQTPESRTNPQYLKSHERVFVDLRKDFRDTGLQFVCEISGILLSPETPEHHGEEWHVQGQLVYDPACQTMARNSY